MANGALSLCHLLAVRAPLQHFRLPWVGTWASHTAHPIKTGGRRKRKGRRKMRKDQERFLEEEVQGRQWSNTVTNEEATEPHPFSVPGTASVLPGQERLL